MKTNEIKKLKDIDFEVLAKFLSMKLDSGEGVLDEFAKLYNAERFGKGHKQFVYVPGMRKDRVVLVAHADTVWDAGYGNTGTEGMGADDRAGCAILWALRGSGHSLLILNGEEIGLQGAKYLRDKHKILFEELNNHQFMIEFDRRGSSDFKTYDVGTVEFDSYVRKMTGYEKKYGSTTDICELCERICGVNLSVGYTDEHTSREDLNVEDWARTLNTTRVWLKHSLPQYLKRREEVYA